MSIIDDSLVDVRAIPIRLLCWRRPAETYRILQKLKQVKPRSLLVSCDGPRTGFLGEKEKVKLVRKILEREIDWECDVYKFYREKNFRELPREDHYKQVYKTDDGKTLDYFHGEAPKVIWLEDDNDPSFSFFRFCAEMLDKYEDNQNVWRITGNNFQHGRKYNDGSYYFSHHAHTWGGAMWWNKYQDFLDRREELHEAFINIMEGSLELPAYISPKVRQYYLGEWRRVFYGDLKDTFDDFLLILYSFLYTKLTTIPNINLVKNIGFSPVEGSNCLNPNSPLIIEASEMDFPLQHPSNVDICKEADNYYYQNVLGIKG